MPGVTCHFGRDQVNLGVAGKPRCPSRPIPEIRPVSAPVMVNDPFPRGPDDIPRRFAVVETQSTVAPKSRTSLAKRAMEMHRLQPVSPPPPDLATLASTVLIEFHPTPV